MNIFVLDKDPKLAAEYHCDKHVVKMILETAQILSTVIHRKEGEPKWHVPKSRGMLRITAPMSISAKTTIVARYQLEATHIMYGLIYKPTHVNHPCTLWATEDRANYNWLVQLLYHLGQEYTKRYSKTHAAFEPWDMVDRLHPQYQNRKKVYMQSKVESLFDLLRWGPRWNRISYDLKPREFEQVVPVQYRGEDPVEAYRRYYVNEKSKIAKWKLGEPNWWHDVRLKNLPKEEECLLI